MDKISNALRIYLFLLFCTWGAQLAAQGSGLLMDEASDSIYNQLQVKSRSLGFQDVVGDEPSYSLKDFVPDVGDQGDLNTCVGWTAAYYARTMVEAVKRKVTDRKEINDLAFSPMFTYLQSNPDSDADCYSGAYLSRAIENMKTQGAVFTKDFEEDCATSIDPSLLDRAGQNAIYRYQKLYDPEDRASEKVDQIKRSLATDNPVILGVKVDESFKQATSIYQPDFESGLGIGHSLCVVGYDDEKEGGAFEAVNSWGTDWGNDGFIWIKYDDLAEIAPYAFEIIPYPRRRASSKKRLSGSLEFKLRYGESMVMERISSSQIDKSLSTGPHYQSEEVFFDNALYSIRANVTQPAFVYVLGAEEVNGTKELFPKDRFTSSYINSDKLAIDIPKRGWIRLTRDFDVPSDYTIVLFSVDELDIRREVKKINALKDGTLREKIRKVFGDRLIADRDLEFSVNRVGFEATFTKGSVAAVVIDIRRE